MQEQPDNSSQSNVPEEVDFEPADQNFRSEAPVRSSINSKPSILSEGFTFEGYVAAYYLTSLLAESFEPGIDDRIVVRVSVQHALASPRAPCLEPALCGS